MGLIILGSCRQCGRYGACIDIMEYVGGVGHQYNRYCARWSPGDDSTPGVWVYDFQGCHNRQAARDYEAEAKKEGSGGSA